MSEKKKVLVVDDSAVMRVLVRKFLSEEFDCVTAENGQDGLSKAIEHKPDAVLADLEMPGMNGIELIKALQANPSTKSIPVIVITTVSAVELVSSHRHLGVAGFVLKPLQKQYLLAKLRHLFETA